MESTEGCACENLPSKAVKFLTTWRSVDYNITVIPKWFNINIEIEYEPKKWGLAKAIIWDGSYSKGSKLLLVGLLGPLGGGLELRYRMGVK